MPPPPSSSSSSSSSYNTQNEPTDTPSTSQPPGLPIPSRRRYSAYNPSHPHPYHGTTPPPEPHPQPQARAFTIPTQTPTTLSRPHRRWFYGPARSDGSPLLPRTPLEREISHGEQQFQMYGGSALREPPPKGTVPLAESPKFLSRTAADRVPSSIRERREGEQEAEEAAEQEEGAEERAEGEIIPAHSFVSPSATLDPDLVGWDGPDDPENPQNWNKRYKRFITALCIIMTLNITYASSAPSVALKNIMAEFKTSREVSFLTTTVFLLGFVFGPLFWGPGSELIGRKPILALTLTLYTVFHLGQTLATNIQTLLITRFLSGFFAVAPLVTSGGVIADVWPAAGRGPAMCCFGASVFLGPVLGPVISGFIIQKGVSWRWVFWVMMFFAAACTVVTIPFLPETYAPILLLRKVRRLRKEDPVGNKNLYAEHEKQDWSIHGVINRTLFRPFKMLSMEPILVLVTIYMAIVYGILYALFQAFPIIFTQHHNFTISQSGLIFIGIGIGTTIGSIINYATMWNYPRLIAEWRGFPPAEYRLIAAMIGSPCLVIGTFWLGWTGNFESVPWYVPGLSTIFVGMGISLIFMSFLSYLVDTYLMYSASAFSANTFVRSAVAAAFPLFTVQMFNNLGVNWACTLIGFIGLLFLPSPFLFYKYGARIREKSRFAPCFDLKIKKEIEEEERSREKVLVRETKV